MLKTLLPDLVNKLKKGLTMKDFNDLVAIDTECVEASLEKLSSKDDKLNYLYYLKDELNKRIKTIKKEN